MKLLSKQDIQAKSASERKMEIDQGLMLARKIDALRKASAEEEANLTKFRDETLKALRQDVRNLISQKKSLEDKIEEHRLYLLKLKKLINEIETNANRISE